MKKRSVMLKFVLSYMCVLIIPVIINGVYYIISSNVIQKEINRANNAVITQIQQTIDNGLLEISKMCTRIEIDSKFLGVMYKDEKTPESSFNMSRMLRDYQSYTITNSYIKEFYIYFHNSDSLLTNISTLEPDEVDFEFDYFKSHDKSWNEIVTDTIFKKHLTTGKMNGEDEIMYIQSLPSSYNEEPMAVIIVLLDSRVIASSLKNIEWIDGSEIDIIDNSDKVIYSSTGVKKTHSFADYQSLIDAEQPLYLNVDNEKMVISHIDSNFSDLIFISKIPYNIFIERVSAIKLGFYIGMIACLILGGFLVIYFSKSNYNPIKEIINYVNNNKKIKLDFNNNEFETLHNIIVNTFEENENIHKTLDMQKDHLKNKLISDLLTGKTKDSHYIENGLKYYKINFKSNHFIVMAFYVEIFSDEISSNLLNEDDIYLMLKKINDEIINKSHIGYITKINNKTVCLININDYKENTKNNIKLLATRVQEIMKNEFNVVCSISISGIYSSLEKIKEAYSEALKIMEYRLILRSNEIISSEDVLEKGELQNQIPEFSLRDSVKLHNSLLSRDYKRANTILSKLLKEYFENKDISISIAKYRLFGIVNILISHIEELKNNNELVFNEELFISSLLKCSTINQLREKTFYILDELDKQISFSKNQKVDKEIMEIIDIIESEFNNPHLSVSMIADNLNLKSYYVSRLFKKRKNINLLDYIHLIRIKKAKELLKLYDYSINDVSKMVGYDVSATFIRIFKKIEGITPGRYKNIEYFAPPEHSVR